MLVLLLYVVTVISAGTGLMLIIDGYRRRPRRDLAERLLSFQPSLANEAQTWLQQH